MRKIQSLENFQISKHILHKNIYSNIYVGLNDKKKVIIIKEIKLSVFNKKEISLKNPIIKELSKTENRNILKIIDLKKDGSYIYLFFEKADSNLEKLAKNEKISEMEGIYIITNIIKGLKYFYKKKIIYKNLNPGNILKCKNDYKLVIPKILFGKLEELNENEIKEDFLFFSPEILRGEKIDQKSDIWSLGCIFYFLLFKKVPFEKNCPNEYLDEVNSKKKRKMKNYILYNHIVRTELEFPENNFHFSIIDVLKKMLVVDSQKRISLENLVIHEFLQYFDFLVNNKTPGNFFEKKNNFINKNKMVEKIEIEQFENYESDLIKKKLHKNFERKKSILDTPAMLPDDDHEDEDYEIDYESLIEIKKMNNTPIMLPDKDNEEDFYISSNKNQNNFQNKNDNLKNDNTNHFEKKNKKDLYFNNKKNTEILLELENALKNNNKEEIQLLEITDQDQNLNVKDLKFFLLNIKKRILLKLKAFDEINRIVKSVYIIIFKFFLLKSLLNYLEIFERKILFEKNPFNSSYWLELKKNKFFPVFVNSLLNLKNKVLVLFKNFYLKTNLLLKKSNEFFNKNLLKFLNEDFTQNCDSVNSSLFKNLIDNFYKQFLKEKNIDKKIVILKFLVLVKVILFIDDYGVFQYVARDLEFSNNFYDIEFSKDIKKIINVYDNL